MTKITRREMLKGAGLVAGGLFSSSAYIPLFGATRTPRIDIERSQYVSRQPEMGFAWSTIARRKDNGELIVTCSGGRRSHVCPFGRVDMFRSYDDGKTWTWPQTIYDGPTDDRDSGICITDKGTILVTTFTSSAYEEFMDLKNNRPREGKWDLEAFGKYEDWFAAHHRINDEQRKKESYKNWIFRSEDDGINWDPRQQIRVNSPHGPVQGFNGRLLYFGDGLFDDTADFSILGTLESLDDGKTWQSLGPIPMSPYKKADGNFPHWNELHGIELSPGKFLVQIRNNDNAETWQTESDDNGKTWSRPHSIDVWGLPSHLLRLKDGRLLMSYGYRRKEFHNQIRVSDDEGKTWSKPIMLTERGPCRDIGYPSTVQLPDESLITVWYELCQGDKKTSLRLTHWRLV